MASRCLLLFMLALSIQTARADEWGYEGEIGPEHWATLDSENLLCAEGRAQSPVNLVETASDSAQEIDRVLDEPVLDFRDRAHVMDLIDNGHTIQVTSDASVSTRIDGELYELVQFHFHGPSEHTLDGRHYPIEGHFVMANEAGDLAVMGVLYEEGEHDPAFDPVFAGLPDGPGDERHLEDLDLDIAELKPLPRRYFRYSGSLTTPPCSEGVKWVVLADPQPLSAEQIETLDSHLHDNNRPVQPLFGRHIVFIRAQ